MSNEERLEDIRAEVEQMAYTSPLNFEKTRINKESALWLIEQVERVQELEEEVEKQKNRKYIKMRQRDDFMKKAQRYKQALEFYAERDNYQWEVSYRPQQEIDCMVIDDSGHTARKALEGDDENL